MIQARDLTPRFLLQVGRGWVKLGAPPTHAGLTGDAGDGIRNAGVTIGATAVLVGVLLVDAAT